MTTLGRFEVRLISKALITLTLALMPAMAFAQVPDHRQVPRDLFPQFDVVADTGAFTDAVICRLNQLDPRWGNLHKNPGQTQLHGHAEDAALYNNPTGLLTAVDFIGGSGGPNPQPGWIVDAPRYTTDDWLPPHNCVDAPTPPNTTPAPNPVDDLQPVTSRIDALAADVRALTAAVNDLRAANQVVGTRVEAVLASNDRIIRQLLEPPDYKGGIFGVPITLRPTVKAVNP